MKESDIRDNKVLEKYLDMVEADVEKLFDKEKFEITTCPACGGGRLPYTV